MVCSSALLTALPCCTPRCVVWYFVGQLLSTPHTPVHLASSLLTTPHHTSPHLTTPHHTTIAHHSLHATSSEDSVPPHSSPHHAPHSTHHTTTLTSHHLLCSPASAETRSRIRAATTFTAIANVMVCVHRRQFIHIKCTTIR